ELGVVTGIGDATGTEAVSERKAYVVLGENLADVLETFIEEVLLVVVGHPLCEDGAAAAHNAGYALGNQRQVPNQHAGMDGHVVHTLLSLFFNHFKHYAGRQVFNPLHARNGFIDRYGADGDRRMAQNRFANFVNLPAGREVHHRVRAVVDRNVELLEFFFDVGADRRVADVGVDLAQRGHPDAHGLEFGMVDVGRNDHAAAGNLVADQLRRKFLAAGDVVHFFADDSLAGVVHLGKIAVAICRFTAGNPLRPRLGGAVAAGVVGSVAVVRGVVRGSHALPASGKIINRNPLLEFNNTCYFTPISPVRNLRHGLLMVFIGSAPDGLRPAPRQRKSP